MPVENFDTGVKLTGEDAPLSTELDQWLLENPGYVFIVNLTIFLFHYVQIKIES